MEGIKRTGAAAGPRPQDPSGLVVAALGRSAHTLVNHRDDGPLAELISVGCSATRLALASEASTAWELAVFPLGRCG